MPLGAKFVFYEGKVRKIRTLRPPGHKICLMKPCNAYAKKSGMCNSHFKKTEVEQSKDSSLPNPDEILHESVPVAIETEDEKLIPPAPGVSDLVNYFQMFDTS